MKSVKERKIIAICYHFYVESKNIQETSDQNTKQADSDIREKTSGYQWGKVRWGAIQGWEAKR